ncbi:MAG: AAA family ATPase [Prevotellaceae bacterium]|nr:AAA family ATPase [Prevotellaceae bacterium]
MKDIKKIVLTGGPCAGKTTALVKVIEHFSSRGYKVFTIPEVPTIFLQAGMDYLTKNQDWFYEGEKSTLEIQLAFEDDFTRMAQTINGPVVIICDRGALDISAYLPTEMWEKITGLCNVTTQQLRDRYDAVLHLVSAADGAEQYYNTTSNEVRTEGIEKARLLDRKVIQAWTGHPHLRVINNHDNFDTKINRVLKEISAVLGLPQPITEERKYIVRVTSNDIPNVIESDIFQTYLVADPDYEVRLRRRRWKGGKTVNVHTTKKRVGTNREIETERQVSNALYESLLAQADPYRHPIHKQRRSFIWKGQYFELDTYHDQLKGLIILETKGITDAEDVNFPPFIQVVEDITGNKSYYNYNLALRK